MSKIKKIAITIGILVLVLPIIYKIIIFVGIGSILYDGLFESTIVDSSEKLNKCFLTTGNYIYYYKINGESYTLKRLKTKPEKFQVLYGDNCFGKDDRNIFYANKILSEADITTFEPVPGQSATGHFGYVYFRDTDSVFIWDELIPEADPQTFRVLPYDFDKFPYYAQDKNNYYYQGKITTDLSR